ncbi:septation protein SepH [Isoptericola sp. b515]|uniref:septation protein SepH n=1 Tax=Isoptericola sp. b515 TaxID=3064652 RepID=UPI0027133E6A|nr:septation protein SepH [Isoptericola sp. b515]MDO8148794.1 septation protein SepH [Isoptericola sp. b515]
MAELELVTLHEDAERLVLRGPDGAEHTLAISEALRAAVRRDRPRTEALQAQSQTPLRPRELQARLRAGATVEELAAESGLPSEHVRRYEWPVAAERDHVIGQVRDHRTDPEGDATLGELADARLAARDVDAAEAVWSARRTGTAPWHVEVRFVAGGRDRCAAWTFDPRSRAVTAVDDEARWLGQPDDPVSPEILGVPTEPRRRPTPPPDPASEATELLLDDLAGRRGQRPHRTRPAPRPGDQELPLGLDGGPPARTDDGASIVDLGARRDAHRSSRAEDTSSAPDASEDPERSGRPDPGADTEEPERPSPDAGAEDASHDRGTDHEDGDHGAEHAPVPVPAPVSAPVPAPVPRPAAPAPATTDRSSSADDAGSPTQDTRSSADDTGSPADDTVAATGTGTDDPSPRPRRGARKGRAPMPSWDEIVFGGARPSS